MEAECEVAASSCSLHVADVVRDEEGPIGSVLNAEHEETSQGAYRLRTVGGGHSQEDKKYQK